MVMFAKGEMEPPSAEPSAEPTESVTEEAVTEQENTVSKTFSLYEDVLPDLLSVYPDTVTDPTAIVIGYKITIADMPVTFPYTISVTELKDCYNASEIGLSPILWNGNDYVLKAWVGMKALTEAIRNQKSSYFSAMKAIRFITL